MNITDVSLFTVSGQREVAVTPPGSRQIRPDDRYDTQDVAPMRYDHDGGGDGVIAATYLEIGTDANIIGLWGPIETDQAFIIARSLRPLLIGQDPLAIEYLWERMARSHRHGRSGLYMTAISAVDCALWDLKGKALDLPVYRLLGGPTRQRVPAYASMLGFSVVPAEAAKVAAEFKGLGYPAQKWFFRYGPAHGEAGQRHNLALAAAVREAVGPDYPIMFDAFMGWEQHYAAEMIRRLAPLHPAWLEEAVPPERVEVFRRLRGPVPLATGEHVYTRWQVRELLDAVDVIQADPDWCGGLSELVKITALASAYEIPVYAHGHSLLPALHNAAAQSPAAVPMVEYLIRHQAHKQHFHTVMYAPDNGTVALPDAPGLGIALDAGKITVRESIFA